MSGFSYRIKPRQTRTIDTIAKLENVCSKGTQIYTFRESFKVFCGRDKEWGARRSVAATKHVTDKYGTFCSSVSNGSSRTCKFQPSMGDRSKAFNNLGDFIIGTKG